MFNSCHGSLVSFFLSFFPSRDKIPRRSDTQRVFLSFTGNGGHMECTQAFLFSLANPHGQRPTKVPLNSGRQGFGIYCDSCNGPTFGRSEYYCTPTTALSISHDRKRRGESQSNDIYEFPRSVSYLFTGLPFFLVTNYEVFGLYD